MALASSRSEQTPLAGIVLAATAFALMTMSDTIFKLMAGAGHPAYQILLVNGIFATIPIAGWAFLTGGFARLHTGRPLLHLARGGISVVSAFCAIYAYSRLPLTDFYAIVFTGPLIVTAMSALWLNETIDKSRWLAIGTGFIGALVVINPLGHGAGHDGHVLIAGRLAAVLSVFCYALSVIMLRRMRLGESNLAFPFFGYMAALIMGGSLLLLCGGPPMHAGDFGHLALSGFLAGTSSICLLTAYQRSPVVLVAPFQYTQIFWGAITGWLLWRHVPDVRLAFGAAIVTVSGLYVIYREMHVAEGRRGFNRSRD